MVEKKYYVIQDRTPVTKDILNLFSENLAEKDIIIKKDTKLVNFVGFIISNNKMLVSFPKHFLSIEELKKYQSHQGDIKSLLNDVSLLYKTIYKSAVKKNTRGIGVQQELNQNYPFKNFIEVYDYFLKFGLYTEQIEQNKTSYHGKINWKRTILKSPVVFNNNNLIFISLESSKLINEYAFISDCMAYVINNTSELLHPFLKFNRVPIRSDYLQTIDKKYIIQHLREVMDITFKDVHKHLIKNLIEFFSSSQIGTHTFKIKMYSFNLVWEEILNNYLNKYFHSINEEGFIIFSEYPNKDPKNFTSKKFGPDKRGKDVRVIKPDYYFIEGENRYIFDAKYYTDEDHDLDYKQITYYFLLKYKDSLIDEDGSRRPLQTYNILIFPTSRISHDTENFKTHFSLDSNYNNDEKNFSIKEQYLNIRKLMKTYVVN